MSSTFTAMVKLGVAGSVLLVAASVLGLAASAAGPAGGLIAFSDVRMDFELVVRTADGTDHRVLRSLDSELDPSLSPDGEWIAFEHRASEDIDIDVVRIDGGGRRTLAGGPGLDIDPAWSPDGTRIAWVTVHEGKGEVYVANADGSSPTRLTEIGPDSGPAWSPDSTRIAFSRGGVLHVVSATGGAPPRQLVSSSFGAMFAPSWSPDGRMIAMESYSTSIKNPQRIFVAPVQPDGQGQPLPLHVGVDPGWSETGEVLFLCAGHLWSVRTDGMNARRLTVMRTSYQLHEEPNAGWSHSSGRFAFGQNVGSRPQIYAMRPDGSRLRRLSEYEAAAPSFSPGGRRLAVYERSGTHMTLSLLEDGRLRRLARFRSNRRLSRPTWSPDGQRIAYEGRGGIFVIGIDGRRYGRIPGTNSRDSEPVWSPKRRTIAFTRLGPRQNDAQIRVVDLRTRRGRLLRGKAHSPAWSPDGRLLTYNNAWFPPYNTDVWVMRGDGTKPRRLTRHEDSDLHPTWSPDGRRIAFLSDRIRLEEPRRNELPQTFQLFVMRVDRGERSARAVASFGGDAPQPSWRR